MLRFESSSQPAGKTVSLPEYGANMKAGQRDIYYLAAPRFGFCALNFLSILSRENLTQKWPEPKAEQFAKLQFLNDKIDQKPIMQNCQLPISLLVIYNCSAFN